MFKFLNSKKTENIFCAKATKRVSIKANEQFFRYLKKIILFLLKLNIAKAEHIFLTTVRLTVLHLSRVILLFIISINSIIQRPFDHVLTGHSVYFRCYASNVLIAMT